MVVKSLAESCRRYIGVKNDVHFWVIDTSSCSYFGLGVSFSPNWDCNIYGVRLVTCISYTQYDMTLEEAWNIYSPPVLCTDPVCNLVVS